MPSSKIWRIAISIPLFLIALAGLCVGLSLLRIPSQESYQEYSLPADVSTMKQNWSADERQQFHFTSFGSKIMPYDLFLNLEQGSNQELLASKTLMTRLGFIVQQQAANNPGGLPVGFSRSDSGWAGMTCAACHTGTISYQGQRFLIDGGPGMLDFLQFESEVAASLTAHMSDQEKFERLALRMDVNSSEERQELKTVIKERKAFFDRRLRTNKVDVDYGYGRLDAFGRIFNAVTSAALDMPDNFHMPDAPVSIPMLWDASHFDLVQWNGSAPNKNPGPLGQNVTTALAVYGEIDMLESGWGYQSSVNIVNLGYIQSTLYKLMSPKWQEDVFGPIDKDLSKQGEAIYATRCISCHELISDRDPNRKIHTKLIDVNLIGTDPTMAKNFATFVSQTGPLEGKKSAVIGGKKFSKQASTIDIVVNATIGALLRKPIDSLTAYLTEDSEVFDAEIDFKREVYKARPLNGIWATGPFLHNGSVPTVFDLLQDVDDRPSQFYVGSDELDVKKLGMDYEENENRFLFDTSLKGNSNQGHLIATDLTEEEKWALIEYLKTL